MNGKYLLDTNIIVALFRNDKKVCERVAASPEIFVPVMAIGELFYGAMNSSQIAQNMKHIHGFAKYSTVLCCDIVTSEHYGRIKSQLKSKGRPLPENDIWIAAIASQYSLTIITRDKHFNEIDSVSLEEW